MSGAAENPLPRQAGSRQACGSGGGEAMLFGWGDHNPAVALALQHPALIVPRESPSMPVGGLPQCGRFVR